MKLTNINRRKLLSTIKLCIVIPVALLVRNFKRNVWIISERSSQARDNGYCFFKYMREQHPAREVYYIIDKKSSDYEKIKQYGKVIQFNSWKHYFYCCLSKVHISAHVNGCCPSDAMLFKRIKKLLKIKSVFIPHGVSYGISEFCLQKYAKINLFICCGKQEYDNVLANYGYNKSEVVYTGFPRLDEWHHITVNPQMIVLMPTWRLYLAQNPNIEFENTVYYKKYQELIGDIQLIKFLEKNHLKLIFYLHHEMRKYVNVFKTESSNIEIVYEDNAYDIQELLKTAALLITDYSSVHFDFAYMQKVVLYYQFDKEEFFKKQYLPGTFDIKKEGFGPVIFEKDTLVQEIKKAWENGFQMSEEYYGRMRAFYQIYDSENCQRVYNEICNRFDEMRL